MNWKGVALGLLIFAAGAMAGFSAGTRSAALTMYCKWWLGQ